MNFQISLHLIFTPVQITPPMVDIDHEELTEDYHSSRQIIAIAMSRYLKNG